MTPLELILSKIPDFGKCRAAGAALLLPSSAAAAAKRGLGGNSGRSRLLFPKKSAEGGQKFKRY